MHRSTCNAIHSGKLGDILYSLPTVRKLKAHLLINNIHQRTHEDLLDTALAQELADFLTAHGHPCEVWDGETKWHYQLDDFRHEAYNHRSKHLVDCHWHSVRLPAKAPRQAWLTVKPRQAAKVVIARSERFPFADNFEWDRLQPTDCIFVGTRKEHLAFVDRFFILPHWDTPSLSDLAAVVSGAELVCANQTLVWAIAEALDKVRALEVNLKHQCCSGFTSNSVSLPEDLSHLSP